MNSLNFMNYRILILSFRWTFLFLYHIANIRLYVEINMCSNKLNKFHFIISAWTSKFWYKKLAVDWLTSCSKCYNELFFALEEKLIFIIPWHPSLYVAAFASHVHFMLHIYFFEPMKFPPPIFYSVLTR